MPTSKPLSDSIEPELFDELLLKDASALATALGTKGLTLATAESCTGGLIGGLCTSLAGSSSWYTGGIIAYSNTIKAQVLNVSIETLERFGAVSDETAKEMVLGCAKLFRSSCAISVTGIAGPDGGTITKPVGLVYIGIAYNETVTVHRFVFGGNRNAVRLQTVRAAISLIAGSLQEKAAL